MLVHELLKCSQLALFLLFAFYLRFLLQCQHTNQALVLDWKSWQTRRLRRHRLVRASGYVRYYIRQVKCSVNSKLKVNIKSSSRWLQTYLAARLQSISSSRKPQQWEVVLHMFIHLLELVSLPLQQRGYTTYKEGFSLHPI